MERALRAALKFVRWSERAIQNFRMEGLAKQL